jgi:CRP-like cAMP-binding protein
VLHKRVALVNPNIFKTTGATVQPELIQKIPDQTYRNQKRGSVFQKVDLKGMDFDNIPNYHKDPE